MFRARGTFWIKRHVPVTRLINYYLPSRSLGSVAFARRRIDEALHVPRYEERGFYLARIGELVGRDENYEGYEIVRKLGYGAGSTLWLARNVGKGNHVAVKILTLEATQNCKRGYSDEFSFMRRIWQGTEPSHRSHITNPPPTPTHPGRYHCVRPVETFAIESDEGKIHGCYVLNVLGGTADSYGRTFENGALPAEWVKVVARQILLALDYLHRECGIIHSDVKPENILLNYGERTESIILQAIQSSTPKDTPSTTDPAIPSQPLPCVPLSDTASLNVQLCDFGHSNWSDRRLHHSLGSPALRAPESILGYPYDTSVDIWAFGCTVFELLTGRALFSPRAGTQGKLTWTYEHFHLLGMLDCTRQSFPFDMLLESKRGMEYFDEEGDFKLRLRAEIQQTLEDILRIYKFLEEKEVIGSNAFIMKCLQLDPRKRASAEELLEDEWLRE